jgi:hypothetical protein
MFPKTAAVGITSNGDGTTVPSPHSSTHRFGPTRNKGDKLDNVDLRNAPTDNGKTPNSSSTLAVTVGSVVAVCIAVAFSAVAAVLIYRRKQRIIFALRDHRGQNAKIDQDHSIPNDQNRNNCHLDTCTPVYADHSDNYYSVINHDDDDDACNKDSIQVGRIREQALDSVHTSKALCTKESASQQADNDGIYHLPDEEGENVYHTVDIATDHYTTAENCIHTPMLPRRPNTCKTHCDNNFSVVSDGCYNTLHFKAKGLVDAQKHKEECFTDDGASNVVYSHLSNKEEDAYNEMNRDRKSEFIGAQYSHIR